MTTATDPLVRRWRTTRRPLNWRVWHSLSDEAHARLRATLMEELRAIDGLQIDARGNGWWRYTHRELVDLKAACGHGKDGHACGHDSARATRRV